MGFFELSKEDKAEIRKNTGIILMIALNIVAIILGISILRYIGEEYLQYSLIASLIIGMGYVDNIVMKLFKIEKISVPTLPSIPTSTEEKKEVPK